jgi:hypothetical protein
MEDGHTRGLALATGVGFALLGAMSLTPGVTTGLYDELAFWGTGSTAELLGQFQTSVLLVLIYFVVAGVCLAAAFSYKTARTGIWFAAISTASLWFYGAVTTDDGAGNFIPLNRADDWLHLGLAVALFGALIVVATPIRRSHGRAAHA